MKRLQHVSFAVATAPRSGVAPLRPGPQPGLSPRDAMWRSRRVESGSDWMDAWVRKPAQR